MSALPERTTGSASRRDGPIGEEAWSPEVVLSCAQARALIEPQFPEFIEKEIVAYGNGWDNTAFLVDRRVLFRFPRRSSAVALMERELRMLPRLAPCVPLPIPVPQYIGRAGPLYGWPFGGYLRLPGRTLCEAAPDEIDFARVAGSLGDFLRALHAIGVDALGGSLIGDEIGRLDPQRCLPKARRRLHAIVSAGWLDTALAARFVAWLRQNPPRPIERHAQRVVHGDLYARHLLIADDRTLCGVIDWGDAHAGDVAVDLAVAHLALPLWSQPAFRAAYGAIDEATWNAARYRALYHALLELDYGIRADDAGMRRIGANALSQIAAAIGERV